MSVNISLCSASLQLPVSVKQITAWYEVIDAMDCVFTGNFDQKAPQSFNFKTGL